MINEDQTGPKSAVDFSKSTGQKLQIQRCFFVEGDFGKLVSIFHIFVPKKRKVTYNSL